MSIFFIYYIMFRIILLYWLKIICSLQVIYLVLGLNFLLISENLWSTSKLQDTIKYFYQINWQKKKKNMIIVFIVFGWDHFFFFFATDRQIIHDYNQITQAKFQDIKLFTLSISFCEHWDFWLLLNIFWCARLNSSMSWKKKNKQKFIHVIHRLSSRKTIKKSFFLLI